MGDTECENVRTALSSENYKRTKFKRKEDKVWYYILKRVPQAESARKATVSIEITVIPAVSTAK